VPDLIRAGPPRPAQIPPLWDGRAAARIVDVISSVALGADRVTAAA
jgi:hypothetical protein